MARSLHLRRAGPSGLVITLRYNPGLVFQVQSPENLDADIALLSRMAARDAAAVSDLYDGHNRRLFGVICRILKDRGEAEEVLQEVFVQAWTRAATYDRSLGSPAGWLLGIARNRAIDRLRANAVRTRTTDALEPPEAPASPEGAAATSERQREVRRALASLPVEQRELIEQAYFLGWTQTELAERAGLPLGTVKTRMRSGMQALRRQLDAVRVQL